MFHSQVMKSTSNGSQKKRVVISFPLIYQQQGIFISFSSVFHQFYNKVTGFLFQVLKIRVVHQPGGLLGRAANAKGDGFLNDLWQKIEWDLFVFRISVL